MSCAGFTLSSAFRQQAAVAGGYALLLGLMVLLSHAPSLGKVLYLAAAIGGAAVTRRVSPWVYLTCMYWFWLGSGLVRRLLEWHAGFNTQAPVLLAPLLMRAADLVVHCSTAPEPFGRVIVEAILAGTPVIAADSGASREILGDAENWLARPNDPHTLAAKISAMLTGAWDIAPLRARIYREFTLPRMAARIEAILAEMP